jgi:hypothetical protein
MKAKNLLLIGLITSAGIAIAIHAFIDSQLGDTPFIVDWAGAIHKLMKLGTQSSKIQAAYISSLVTGGVIAFLLMRTDLDLSEIKRRLDNSNRAGKLGHAFLCALIPIAPIFVDMEFTPQNRGYELIKWAEESPLGLAAFSSGVYVLSCSLLAVTLIILTKKGTL